MSGDLKRDDLCRGDLQCPSCEGQGQFNVRSIVVNAKWKVLI